MIFLLMMSRWLLVPRSVGLSSVPWPLVLVLVNFICALTCDRVGVQLGTVKVNLDVVKTINELTG